MGRDRFLADKSNRVCTKLAGMRASFAIKYGELWMEKINDKERINYLEVLDELDDCGHHSYE